MPVELHERLSEFSYGYGITRETQALLQSTGLRVTPFLPSLLHEAEIGCDVFFHRAGTPLMLQFKLGQELARFRRDHANQAIPNLARPFWRFFVDTLEPDGQYDLLLKAEQNGAEVYYVAPKFSSWDSYAKAFESEAVLERSLLLSPTQIERALTAQPSPAGYHKVLYDDTAAHVCSDPVELIPVRASDFPHAFEARVRGSETRIEVALQNVLEGLDVERSIEISESSGIDFGSRRATIQRLREARQLRLSDIRARARSQQDATFAALGMEAWSLGAQLIAVTT